MGRRGGTAVALLTAVSVLALSVLLDPARAEESISSVQLRQLAGRAMEDPAALERLRQVRAVDGQPVDLGLALGGPREATAQRLRVLAEGARGEGPLPPAGSAEAARQASDILDSSRFQAPRAPRPFRGILRRLGGWLRPLAQPVGRFLDRLFDSAAFWWAAGAVVVALATFLSVRAARRRTGAGLLPGQKLRREGKADPGELEREADEAESRGELDKAFRLRFLAGLLRLDHAGHLSFRPSLTTGEVVRTVRSATLPALAGTLEDIVYRGREARPEDVQAARSAWPRVLQEAGSS